MGSTGRISLGGAGNGRLVCEYKLRVLLVSVDGVDCELLIETRMMVCSLVTPTRNDLLDCSGSIDEKGKENNDMRAGIANVAETLPCKVKVFDDLVYVTTGLPTKAYQSRSI